MNTKLKTLMSQHIFDSNICRILCCNLLERIVPYRTQRSGGHHYRNQQP